LEELPSGVHSLDLPAQVFPEDLNDDQIAGSASEGEGQHRQTQPTVVEENVSRRSGRMQRPTQQFPKSQAQLAKGIVLYFTTHESIDPQMYKEDLSLKEFETDPISFKATANPDTMYLHEAMRAPDAEQCNKAMKKEMEGHIEKGHWVVVRKTDVPSHAKILPSG
jgi:hypothetical protein